MPSPTSGLPEPSSPHWAVPFSAPPLRPVLRGSISMETKATCPWVAPWLARTSSEPGRPKMTKPVIRSRAAPARAQAGETRPASSDAPRAAGARLRPIWRFVMGLGRKRTGLMAAPLIRLTGPVQWLRRALVAEVGTNRLRPPIDEYRFVDSTALDRTIPLRPN